MRFLVIERFRSGDAAPVYARFAERGRMAPEGLVYVDSWIDEDVTRCYQLMETGDRALLDAWIARWNDLVDFEVVPVISSAEAAARVAARGSRAAPAAAAVEGATPILCVRDLAASVAHWVEVLGFEVAWQDPGMIACVSRGRCGVFLVQGDQGGPGTWIWIGVSDVEALHRELLAKGARVRVPPTSYRWAYEMQVEDPDGHVLRFGSEPRLDVPPGDWLDMRGVRWRRGAAGWERVSAS